MFVSKKQATKQISSRALSDAELQLVSGGYEEVWDCAGYSEGGGGGCYEEVMDYETGGDVGGSSSDSIAFSDNIDAWNAEHTATLEAANEVNLQRLATEIAKDAGKTELFTIGDFRVTVSGDFFEGVGTAAIDCLKGTSVIKGANDLAGAYGGKGTTPVSGTAAAGLGCLIGVGAGIIRDIE